MELIWYKFSTFISEITKHCKNQRLNASVPQEASGDIFSLLNTNDPTVNLYLNQFIFASLFKSILTSR